MYRIIDDRGTGKTSRLMLLAKETGATIVCNNPQAMRTKAYSYGITGLDFISYYDFVNDYEDEKKYLIDELESFTIYKFGGKDRVIGYSMTKEN